MVRSKAARQFCWIYAAALVLAIASSLTLPGCYHFSVKEQSTSGNGITRTEMRSAFFWGLIEEPIELHPQHDQEQYRTPGRGLHVVEVRTNFAYSLATVLTLGIWCPAEVTWISQPGSDFGPRDEGGRGDGR